MVLGYLFFFSKKQTGHGADILVHRSILPLYLRFFFLSPLQWIPQVENVSFMKKVFHDTAGLSIMSETKDNKNKQLVSLTFFNFCSEIEQNFIVSFKATTAPHGCGLDS